MHKPEAKRRDLRWSEQLKKECTYLCSDIKNQLYANASHIFTKRTIQSENLSRRPRMEIVNGVELVIKIQNAYVYRSYALGVSVWWLRMSMLSTMSRCPDLCIRHETIVRGFFPLDLVPFPFDFELINAERTKHAVIPVYWHPTRAHGYMLTDFVLDVLNLYTARYRLGNIPKCN